MSAAGAIAVLVLLAFAPPGPGRPTPRSEAWRASGNPFEALVAVQGLRTPEAAQARRDALAELAAASPHAVREVLGQAAASGTPIERARAALLALAHLGTSADLALALRLSRPDAEADFERALLCILLRSADALERLGPLLSGARPEARSSILAAVARRGTPEAAQHLARWCREHEELRREGLARLARMAARLPRPVPDELRRAARDALAGADAECLSAAVLAAGEMRDSDAIGHLVALLEHDQRSVRQEARWALERITALDLGAQASRWREWFETERAWWAGESAAAFAALERGDRGAKTAALLDVGRRRTWRDELAARVRPLARDADAEVAALAAETLRRLGGS